MSAPKDEACLSMGKCEPVMLNRWMKALNVLDALFIATAGVLAFILNTPPSLLRVLSAIYVICFALLMLCFECHLRSMDEMIANNFGFMFKWYGRTIFFVFAGTLCFGLDTFGIVAGCVTAFTVLINVWATCVNPSYRDYMERDSKALQARAAVHYSTSPGAPMSSKPAQPPAIPEVPGGGLPISSSAPAYSSTGVSHDSNPFTVDVNLSAGGKAASVPVSVQLGDVSRAGSGSATLPAGWEKVYDSNTGRYYFFNAKTQESRWEMDGIV